jgi:hypothetical protein
LPKINEEVRLSSLTEFSFIAGLVAFNLISEREEVRLKNMNTAKHVPLCEHEEFKS